MFDPKSLEGTTVGGRYVLAEHLGSGSFGWVYAADRVVLGEVVGPCAVKLVRPCQDDEAQRQAVMAEIRAMARLQHPRVLTFHDAGGIAEGSLRGAIFIAMELAQGTLADRLRLPGALSEAEVLGMARDVAEALAYMHAQGAVHRDVKPANVFRTDAGWRLGDLGLARAVQGSALVASGRKGTPLYMAPEVCDGLVGPSVDVWSLGVILQQCAAGQYPYAGGSEAEILVKLVTQEPVIAASLPPALEPVVRGCLVKDRARRWSAEQVLSALAGGTSGAPGTGGAPVQGAARPARPPAGRSGPPEGARGVLDAERWVLVPAGRFRMGSPADDGEATASERPVREVTLTRPFHLKVTPVTQAELEEIMDDANPSEFRSPDRPVENVTWFDAVRFCNRLSLRAGLPEAYLIAGERVVLNAHTPGFRLPTEAEWEFACRGGTTAPRYGDLDDIAWYGANSHGGTQPVRGKTPNLRGLHDMLGNVWEWCWDWWGDTYAGAGTVDPTGPASGASNRVNRGGSWRNDPRFVRAAFRNWFAPGGRIGNLGFRPARSGP